MAQIQQLQIIPSEAAACMNATRCDGLKELNPKQFAQHNYALLLFW